MPTTAAPAIDLTTGLYLTDGLADLGLDKVQLLFGEVAALLGKLADEVRQIFAAAMLAVVLAGIGRRKAFLLADHGRSPAYAGSRIVGERGLALPTEPEADCSPYALPPGEYDCDWPELVPLPGWPVPSGTPALSTRAAANPATAHPARNVPGFSHARRRTSAVSWRESFCSIVSAKRCSVSAPCWNAERSHCGLSDSSPAAVSRAEDSDLA